MSEVSISRKFDFNLLKIKVEVNGGTYSLPASSSITLSLPEGEHLFKVSCWGYSGSKVIDVRGDTQIRVEHTYPVWLFQILILCILSTFVLCMLDFTSIIFFSIPLLLNSILFLFVIISNKDFFRLIEVEGKSQAQRSGN